MTGGMGAGSMSGGGMYGPSMGMNGGMMSNQGMGMNGGMMNNQGMAGGQMGGQMGMQPQRPLPPGTELPTPAPLPDEGATDPNQGAIVAAILGGSALIGLALGCLLFRNKGGPEGDSDDDADSDDDSDESD